MLTRELYRKFIRNECSLAEIEQLIEEFGKPENELLVRNLIGDELSEGQTQTLPALEVQQAEQAIYDQLKEQLFPVRKRRLWPRIAVAASLLLATAGTFYLVQKNKQQPVNQSQALQHDLPPGHNGAVLTLANGQQIALEAVQKGAIAKQNGSQLNKTGDSLLVYQTAQAVDTAVTYNTLETPNGRQYSVVLPDGTLARLNAASRLRYPTTFSKTHREVELSGEGYFEVVHNEAAPFRVKTDAQTIEDIGTRFNISSYSDEPQTTTTLIEGAVSVKSGDRQVSIRPGQQATSQSGELSVSEGDITAATAWLQGYFYFDHADLKTVMLQIARWYDLEVSYEGTLPQKQFKGKIYRKVKLSQALKILSFFNVHYRLDGKHLIITS